MRIVGKDGVDGRRGQVVKIERHPRSCAGGPATFGLIVVAEMRVIKISGLHGDNLLAAHDGHAPLELFKGDVDSGLP
jgi:hypothetical protein